MPHPLLSGFCNPTNPSTSHGMCRMPGCTCSCHQLAVDSGSAPRVKVSLACLQGRHTAECGHLAPDLEVPDPAAETTLDRLLDKPVPGGDTVTFERGGGVRDDLEPPGVQTAIPDGYDDAVTTAYDGTAIDDAVALPLEVELTAEERRQVIAGHLVLHPDAILEAVRIIVERRLTESTVAP